MKVINRLVRGESDNFPFHFQLDPCALLEVETVLEVGSNITLLVNVGINRDDRQDDEDDEDCNSPVAQRGL